MSGWIQDAMQQNTKDSYYIRSDHIIHTFGHFIKNVGEKKNIHIFFFK